MEKNRLISFLQQSGLYAAAINEKLILKNGNISSKLQTAWDFFTTEEEINSNVDHNDVNSTYFKLNRILQKKGLMELSKVFIKDYCNIPHIILSNGVRFSPRGCNKDAKDQLALIVQDKSIDLDKLIAGIDYYYNKSGITFRKGFSKFILDGEYLSYLDFDLKEAELNKTPKCFKFNE